MKCEEKRSYDYYLDAGQVIRVLKKKGIKQWIYLCEICNKFHLTSKDQNKKGNKKIAHSRKHYREMGLFQGECRCSINGGCKGDVLRRSLYKDQLTLYLCTVHHKQMEAVAVKRDFNELEQEDYDFYLNKINKYHLKNQKPLYDPLAILQDGNTPEFKSDVDRYQCAMEVAFFMRAADMRFEHHEDYLENFLALTNALGPVHFIILIRQLTLPQMESWISTAKKYPKWNVIIKNVMGLIGDE